jgi:beta-phosphoglucomutase-like phosphatase (HAD superfamily)
MTWSARAGVGHRFVGQDGAVRGGANSDRLVIFDCDGVLVDSERLSIEVDRQVLAEIGWHLTTDQIIEKFVGRSHGYFLTQVEAFLGGPVPDGWDQECEPRYRAAYRDHLQPVPGVVEALDQITA